MSVEPGREIWIALPVPDGAAMVTVESRVPAPTTDAFTAWRLAEASRCPVCPA